MDFYSCYSSNIYLLLNAGFFLGKIPCLGTPHAHICALFHITFQLMEQRPCVLQWYHTGRKMTVNNCQTKWNYAWLITVWRCLWGDARHTSAVFVDLVKLLFKQPNEFDLSCVLVVFLSNKESQRGGGTLRQGGRPHRSVRQVARLLLTSACSFPLMSIYFILPKVGYDY